MPVYKQKLKQEAPAQREVARWTDQSVAALQDTLDDADWDMFRRSSDDVKMFTEAIVGFIGKLVDDTVQKTTIRTFPNQKPWVDKTIHDALRSRSTAYNMGLATRNMHEYKAASYSVLKAIKEAKRHYGRKLESRDVTFSVPVAPTASHNPGLHQHTCSNMLLTRIVTKPTLEFN
ncbi:hypothetical protein Q7C36_021695 [Tachysurus vachellii]|uniref:Uncharacterized protein n=1 Tax=Tachysurus vachellii TaxID=175792 RepID=A0AA88LIL7_TACVA|nr:hypothetical protein Q7C36_021695 [Tachysurus vachellii]